MTKQLTNNKQPNLASKSLLRFLYHMYGKKHFAKFAPMTIDGDIDNLPMPCVIIANHASFADVTGVAYILQKRKNPVAPCYVASQTQYANYGNILNKLGVLPKKQFTVDTSLVRDIKYVLDKGRPLVLYPEAKLSVVGKPSIVKKGIAKLIKLLKVPLVTIRFDGSYLYKPRWANNKRKVPLKATVKCAVNSEEIGALSVDEIFERIKHNLYYDDYKYQLDNGIKIATKDRAEGLHSLLFQCPTCGEMFQMRSKKATVTCMRCGSCATMDEYGVLRGNKFSSVPQWYEWQCNNVLQKIQQGDFAINHTCTVTRLEGTKFVTLGKGTLQLTDQELLFVDSLGIHHSFKRGTFYTLSFDGNAVFLPCDDYVYKLLMPDNGITTLFNIAIEQYALLDDNI